MKAFVSSPRPVQSESRTLPPATSAGGNLPDCITTGSAHNSGRQGSLTRGHHKKLARSLWFWGVAPPWLPNRCQPDRVAHAKHSRLYHLLPTAPWDPACHWDTAHASARSRRRLIYIIYDDIVNNIHNSSSTAGRQARTSTRSSHAAHAAGWVAINGWRAERQATDLSRPRM
jgi:hypothetical protein